jgi:hypothetical protein
MLFEDRVTRFRLALLGCTAGSQSSTGWSFAGVEPPIRHAHPSADSKQSQWIHDVEAHLRRWPLAWVINRIERLATEHTVMPVRNSDIEIALAELATSWRFSRGAECLPRALFRYKWLRARSLHPILFLGTHVPTDQMHAWVTLNGRVIGEEPDEMLCYQAAVRFFAQSGPGEGAEL